MGSENAHDHSAAEPPQVVHTNNRIADASPHQVRPDLVFDDLIDAGVLLEGPLHVADGARSPKPVAPRSDQYLFDGRQHAVLVEGAAGKIELIPAVHLELAALFRFGDGQALRFQVLDVLPAYDRVDDMHSLVATLQSFFNEGEEHARFFLLVVEEGTNVRVGTELRAG